MRPQRPCFDNVDSPVVNVALFVALFPICTSHNCLFIAWLLNVPATGECISGTDLLRQFYVLPH